MTTCNMIRLSLLLAITVGGLSACGGGAGSGDSSNGGFTTSNANTKPQSSVTSIISSSTDSVSSKSQSSLSSSSRGNTTTIDTQPPSPPANLTYELVLSDRVIINWNPSTDNVGTAFYKIYRDQAQIDTVYASDLVYYDFDVAAGRSYTYSLSAGDASGNWSALTNLDITTPNIIVAPSSSSSSAVNVSASSSVSSAITNSSQISSKISSSASSSTKSSADTIAPAQPSQVTKLNAFSKQIDIGWTAATDNVGVALYRVYRDGLLLDTLSGSLLSYTDKSVLPNMSYWYGVSAGDAAGNWSAQQLVNIASPAPTTSGNITLKWAPPSQRENGAILPQTEIGGYELRYRSILENSYKYQPIPGTQTQISLSNLNGDYVFEIAVFDTNGVYSNFVSITPQ